MAFGRYGVRKRTCRHYQCKYRIIMKNMNGLGKLAFVLVIIGGLNWGLVGILDFNLVSALLGDMTVLARTVYALVGLSALFALFGGGQKRTSM